MAADCKSALLRVRWFESSPLHQRQNSELVAIWVSYPDSYVRGSYSGNTLAFQAKARSSILLPRSIMVGVVRFLTGLVPFWLSGRALPW
jgi:hypothetical protein